MACLKNFIQVIISCSTLLQWYNYNLYVYAGNLIIHLIKIGSICKFVFIIGIITKDNGQPNGKMTKENGQPNGKMYRNKNKCDRGYALRRSWSLSIK